MNFIQYEEMHFLRLLQYGGSTQLLYSKLRQSENVSSTNACVHSIAEWPCGGHPSNTYPKRRISI